MDEYAPVDPETDPETGVDEPDKPDLIWEEPPLRGGSNSGKWRELLSAVMTQPGKWARVMECQGMRRGEMHVGNLRSGKIRVPEGKWEFQSRSDKTTGKSWVYARYCGPEKADEGAFPVGAAYGGTLGPRTSADSDGHSPDRVLRESEPAGAVPESPDAGPEAQVRPDRSFEEMVASEQTG